MITEKKNLDLYQDSYISLSHCWQGVYQFLVMKGLDLYELVMNVNFNVFFKTSYLFNQ